MNTTPEATCQRRPSRYRGRHRAAIARLVAVIATLGGLLAGCGTPTGVGGSPGDTTSASPSSSADGSLGPAADSSTAKYGVKLDVVEAGNVLRTTEGRTYPLGDHLGYVVRIPIGWLYGRTDVAGPVNLLRPDGSSVQLPAVMERQGLDMPGSPVVSADGRRIAWSKGSVVFVGTLTPTGITDVVSSPAPTDTYPLTWNGSLVVLGQPYAPGCCGYRRVQYDVWDPARGTFVPHWTRELWPLYGPVPSGTPLFGIHQTDATGSGCLVQVDGVKDLGIIATACLPGLMVGSLRGLLAPDGRHLVEGVGDKIEMFALPEVMTTKAPLRVCPGDWPRAWEDNNTVLVENTTTKAVNRCHVDGTTPATVPGLTLAVPGTGTGTGVTLVPRVG